MLESHPKSLLGPRSKDVSPTSVAKGTFLKWSKIFFDVAKEARHLHGPNESFVYDEREVNLDL